MVGYDILGDIAILKFDKEKNKEKKEIAKKLLEERKSLKTILEKTEKVKGRLRTIKTKYLAGEKKKEALYKENNCLFKFNVESCYFSPRLSGERLEVAKMIRKEDKVLVMFAGVGPFSVVIGRISQAQVVSVELGKECCKYSRENVQLNKLRNIKVIQGDVKKKVNSKLGKFEVIVMPRPQLKEDFLKEAFSVSKKNTRIYYYDFGKEPEEIVDKVLLRAREYKKKIKIENIKKAGDIAPFKYRWRVDLRVL